MARVRISNPAGEIEQGEWINGSIRTETDQYRVEEVDVLPPTTPDKLVGAAKNYRGGIDDPTDIPDEPILFVKTPNTVASPETCVRLPQTDRVLFEGELGVVIGERCRNVSKEAALETVAGYTCANDITNRAAENIVRRKSFDNAAPLGPTLVSHDSVPDDAAIETRINGEVKQRSSISELIFSIPELIASVTADLTLEPGDVILTGSPPGMEPLQEGDRVAIEIESVGTLEHTVTFHQ